MSEIFRSGVRRACHGGLQAERALINECEKGRFRLLSVLALLIDPVRLGEGQFFGEIAVLKKTRRTATIRSTQPTKLLALDAADLHVLTERSPGIGRSIERAAMERTQQPAGEPGAFTSAD